MEAMGWEDDESEVLRSVKFYKWYCGKIMMVVEGKQHSRGGLVSFYEQETH